MYLTLDKLLKDLGLCSQNTVYKNMSKHVMDAPFCASKAFTDIALPTGGGWGLLVERQLQIEEMQRQPEYISLQRERNEIGRSQALLKTRIKDGLEADLEGIRILRSRRKQLEERLSVLEEQYADQVNQKLFGTSGAKAGAVLCYKDCLYAVDPKELAEQIPPLRSLTGFASQGPLFTSGVESFKQAIESKKRTGVVGGPCLFGAWEVEICIALEDGRRAEYDFTTGVPYDEQTESQFAFDDVQDFICQYGKVITNVHFVLHKNSLTVQESAALEYVLQIAGLFQAEAYIPLPDMSYQKYLAGILHPVSKKSVRDQAMYAFKMLAYDQTDLFLSRVEKIRKEYPGVRITTLHERDEIVMEKYMEKRMEYIQRFAGRTNQLTRRSAWAESILDYVTMPALPFYLDGIEDVIEADTLDEADSWRKCQKLHQKSVSIHPLFFPEPVCPGREESMFYAPLKAKKYLSEVPVCPKEYDV